MAELTDDESSRSTGVLDDADPNASVPRRASDHVRTLECRTVATTRLRQRHHIRDLEPIGSRTGTAEPASLLNGDDEPHPFEMLLAALGACLTVSIQANAVARGIPIRSLVVHSRGDVDPSALWGTGNRRATPLGFQSIAIDVHVDADVPREALKSLVDHAVLWSPVANTLHDPVHIDVTVSEPGSASSA